MKLGAHLETTPCEFIVGLERDVRIGRERENNLFAFPGWLEQFFSQQLGSVDLGDDLAIKVSPGAIAKIFVRGPAEAVGAAMNTTTVTVQRIIKTDVRTVVVTDD